MEQKQKNPQRLKVWFEAQILVCGQRFSGVHYAQKHSYLAIEGGRKKA